MRTEFSPLATPEEATPDRFPYLGNMSAGALFRYVPVPDAEPGPPEIVYLTPPPDRSLSNRQGVRFDITISNWNATWEAGPFNPYLAVKKWCPKQLRWLQKVQDRHLRLVPRGRRHQYDAYAPLYHLLPASVLKAAGLPLLERGHWPHFLTKWQVDKCLTRSFDERLSEAFSRHVWPLLNGRTVRKGFRATEPIRVLSHHLDFWLPYIDLVAQRRCKWNGRYVDKDDEKLEQDLQEINRINAGNGATAMHPLCGGTLWIGEEEAWEATQELVDVADEHGALRSIIDAVKSHRLQDDFSQVWSYEREDFERKLYCKRSKVKVSFVELTDTVPVYSQDSEVLEHFLWGDFMVLLDAKERRVAVCLRRGTIGPVDIAAELGYANHSPVSKALRKIRKKAATFFELN